jgi:cytochrome c oxidase subunit II
MSYGLPSASSLSPEVDLIFKCLLAISTVLVVMVWGLIIYFCIKYRRGSAADREISSPKNIALEISLSTMIFIFGLGIFIWSAKVFYRLYLPPASALDVSVIAKQWMWVFHDAQGKDQINSFKVPLGKPVRLLMTSEDVIHSLFIPAFRIKQDVLPGRYTSLWFQPTQVGNFEILCTQYCGLSHSQMRATVEVLTPEDYEKYLKENTNPNVAQKKGAELYVKHSCNACHDGSPPRAPSLNGLFGKKIALANGSTVVADENYLRRSILNPNADIAKGYPAVMPTFQGSMTESDLLSIIQYLKTKR